MATSSPMNTSNQWIKYTITVTQNSQSIINNTSNVTVSVRFYRTNTGYESYGTGTVYCKIDGTQYSQGVVWTQKITNEGIVLFSKTLDIKHSGDGTKKLTCSAWIDHEVVTSSEQSYSQNLTTISRASGVAVDGETAQMGKTIEIWIYPNSSSFTHNLKYSFGTETGTIVTGLTEEAYEWKAPDLVSKFPGKTSIEGKVICDTYLGNELIGSENASITLFIPNKSKPRAEVNTVQMGKSVKIYTDRNSTGFTHSLTYTFGGVAEVFATDVGESKEWTVPDLAAQISNKSSGTCKITCKTYTGSTLVGSDTVSVTLTIPDKSTPSASASTVKMGTSVNINTNRNSSGFTHTLQYTFGGTTETIKTGVVDSQSWEVPDIAHLCNNKLSDTCTITCITYNGNLKVGEATCSITLNVQDKTVPSFPNGDVIIGSGNPITTKANSNNFSHIIRYSFNGKTGTVDDEKKKSDIVWWTPYDLASAIPSDTSGNGTITCETYNGSALVGTSNPVAFKAIVPENSTTKPSFVESGFALFPSGNLNSVFNGLYIQGKTGVKAQFTASSPYSTIASCKMSVEGRVYEGNPATSNVLNIDGSVEVVGTVTDARGYYTTVPTSISVIPYRIPRIDPFDGDKEITCERCNQSGEYTPSGTFLRIRAKRSYHPVSQKNLCHLKLRYKATGGSWSEERTLLSGSNTSTDLYDNFKNGVINDLDDVILETEKTYLVQLIVEDTIGERIPYDFPISTDKVTLHLGFGGHGVAVGKYSEATADNEMFESQWDAKFHGDLYAAHIASLGTYDSLDFNELVYKTGYYTSASTPSASGCSHYPVDKTGVLEVISASNQDGWGFAYQTYRTHDGEVYMRSYYSSNGFTVWNKIQFST